MSILIEGGNVIITQEDSPKEIWSVNGVRLDAKTIEVIKQEAHNALKSISLSIESYIRKNPSRILKLRNEEPITFEDHENGIVVIPHGNIKEVAKKGGKAFIASPIDQSQFSLEFFKNASGKQLKALFDAVAKTAKQEGLDIEKLFAVLHLRSENAPHIVAPQIYTHIHFTDENNINPDIIKNRLFVPHPKSLDPNKIQIAADNKASGSRSFEVRRLSGYLQESHFHSVVSGQKSFTELLQTGSEQEWSAWRDAICNDEQLMFDAKKNGIRLVFEKGVTHVHGGQPLYQGTKPTRWSAPAQNL